jgi:hypothetical protein
VVAVEFKKDDGMLTSSNDVALGGHDLEVSQAWAWLPRVSHPWGLRIPIQIGLFVIH